MRKFGLGLVCALALAACDKPATESSPPAVTQSQNALIRTMPRTLSADEAANFQVAVAQLPEGAVLSHAVAEGPAVAVHYIAQTAEGPIAGVQYLLFDPEHVIVDSYRVDLPADPRPHVTGATIEAPEQTSTQTEVANKQAVLAFLQALTNGQVDAAANRVSDDMVEHTGTGAQGRAAWTALIRSEPARQYGVQHLAAWSDIVMTYQSVGTTTPEGVRWAPGYDIFRLRDGKIVERWRLNY